MTVNEYAERLRVSRNTLFKLIKLGLPTVMIGRIRRILVEKADRWIQGGGADLERRSSRTKRRSAR
ncbi:MAG: excisionase family DNA-binding protein [Myxococcota bacterium]|nr:excisionase family DNA-binding protein [Myxococcota bacterium]